MRSGSLRSPKGPNFRPKQNRKPPENGWQLSLHGHDLSPGSGYYRAWALTRTGSFQAIRVLWEFFLTRFRYRNPYGDRYAQWDSCLHMRVGGGKADLKHTGVFKVFIRRYGLLLE